MLHRFITPGGAPPQQAYMVSPPQAQTMYPMQPTYHPSGLVKYSPQGQLNQGPTYPPGSQYQYQGPQGQYQGHQGQYQGPQGQYRVQGHLYPPLQGGSYQGSQAIQGVPPRMQGVPHLMQGAPQAMQNVPQHMQGVPQTIQVPPQGVPQGSGSNINHPGSGYNTHGAHAPSSIYSASWASDSQTIQSPPQNILSPTSGTQVSSLGLKKPSHLKEPSHATSPLKQPPFQSQEWSTEQNQGQVSSQSSLSSSSITPGYLAGMTLTYSPTSDSASESITSLCNVSLPPSTSSLSSSNVSLASGSASQASSHYPFKDMKSVFSTVSDSESAASSTASSPRRPPRLPLARTVEDQTTFRARSPPIAPHPFASRKPYETSNSEDVDKIFESRASIHGIRISAPGTEKPPKEPSSKTQAPKKVYQQKVKADRFMEIALKRGITVSSGGSVVSEESSSEAARTGDNSSVNSVADADELVPFSESDDNCDVRSYFSDSCSPSDSESYLIDFSNQFARIIIEKACAELAKEAKKRMLDIDNDEESVSMDSEVQEYFDAPVRSNSVEPVSESEDTIQRVYSDSQMNQLYVDTEQPSSLNAGASEFVSQTQLTSTEPTGLSLNPESPEFKPSFFRQNTTIPTEDSDPTIALYKKNCSSGVDVYIADRVDVEEFEDAQDDLKDAQHHLDSHNPVKKVLLVDASVNTKRVKHKDVEQQTPLAFEPRDVSVNTDEVCMVEGSQFFNREILQRTAGTNTTLPESKHRGVQARLGVDTKNCGVQVGSDDFKPSPQKDLMIVELQMQLCHLRAQMCISELERQKNELKRSKFQINTFFHPGDDNEDHLTSMLNARIGWLEEEISQTKIKLMKSLETLQEGLPLDSVPTFGIAIPTAAAGNIVYRPKEVKIIRDENAIKPVYKTQKKFAMEQEPNFHFTEKSTNSLILKENSASSRISTRDLVKESLADLQRERKLLDKMDAVIQSDSEEMPLKAHDTQTVQAATSTDLLKHSMSTSPQGAQVLAMAKASTDPSNRSVAELSTEIDKEGKQMDTSATFDSESNIESMSFGERLKYFESKSKSLDTSADNSFTQDGSKVPSKQKSPSEKLDQFTPENNSSSLQTTVNEKSRTELEPVETVSESSRVGHSEIVLSTSTDSSSLSLLPSTTPPGLSVSYTPSPLKPLSLPLPSKPLNMSLKQEETAIEPSNPEANIDCIAPPGFKEIERVQETRNDLDLETDELVQKAQSLHKNFKKMKQSSSKQPIPASSPTKPLSSPTKPLTSPTKPVISPPSLVEEPVVADRSDEDDENVEKQTCQSDDGNTGISQLILSAKKKLRESKILEKQFERSLSNSPIDFESNSDRSSKTESQDVSETISNTLPQIAASDSQSPSQAPAQSQDISQEHQPQASDEPSPTLLPIRSKSKEPPQQQVAVPPQPLQPPHHLQLPQSQHQGGVAQPQHPTPQINPHLYQTVLAQVAKAYPHLTANPMMLHSVCLQQTMVLQAYMKNSQNPGTGPPIPPGQPQGPPQGIQRSNSFGQAPVPAQGLSVGLQRQSQGLFENSHGIDSTLSIPTAANTQVQGNQEHNMPGPSVSGGQAQNAVLQPLSQNKSDLSSSIVGAGDSQKSAFQSVKPNRKSDQNVKSLNPSFPDHMMQMRKGTGDANFKPSPPSTFTFQASAGPITITGKAGDTENIPPASSKNRATKPKIEFSSETSAIPPTNPFDQTSGFTKVTYQKKRPTTRGKPGKTSPNPEELFPKVKARQVPTDEDWEGQCESYPEEFTCKQDVKAPVYFAPIEPPARSLDDFAIPKPPKSEEEHKPRGRGRRRNNSSRSSTRSNTPSDDSASSSRRNSYLGLDDFGSDVEAKPTNVDTNFLGRLLKHTVKSNNRRDKEKEERRAAKTPDPEKKKEETEEDWQTVSQKKRKRDQVRADQLPSMAVVPAQTSKTQKSSTRNNFEKLVDHLEKTFPFLSRQELKDLIQTIRYQRGGGLTGMKMNDIVDAARLIIQQQLKEKLLDDKKPMPVPQSTKSVYCTPEFQKHLDATKSYLPSKPVIRSPGEDSNDEDVCPICFENFNVNKKQRLDCGHEFHVECIREWVMKHERTCPTCRRLTLFQEEFPRLK